MTLVSKSTLSLFVFSLLFQSQAFAIKAKPVQLPVVKSVTALSDQEEADITAILVEDVKQVRNLKKPGAKDTVISAKLLTVTEGGAVAPLRVYAVVYDCSNPMGDYCATKTFRLPIAANSFPKNVKFVGKAPGDLVLSFETSLPKFNDATGDVTYVKGSVSTKITAAKDGAISPTASVTTPGGVTAE